MKIIPGVSEDTFHEFWDLHLMNYGKIDHWIGYLFQSSFLSDITDVPKDYFSDRYADELYRKL